MSSDDLHTAEAVIQSFTPGTYRGLLAIIRPLVIGPHIDAKEHNYNMFVSVLAAFRSFNHPAANSPYTYRHPANEKEVVEGYVSKLTVTNWYRTVYEISGRAKSLAYDEGVNPTYMGIICETLSEELIMLHRSLKPPQLAPGPR